MTVMSAAFRGLDFGLGLRISAFAIVVLLRYSGARRTVLRDGIAGGSPPAVPCGKRFPTTSGQSVPEGTGDRWRVWWTPVPG
ncbi:hypothetical protein ACFFX0_16965 [Citricoccus parietis]|uniref:Uncharacterized protein n=1 Tax=Citricoccus parietis TaxID=592307 RepID=A0ABV5G1I8_9MICC